ncbi:MAG: hypothetical protein ABID71_02525 [Chloroflexota bacterium]
MGQAQNIEDLGTFAPLEESSVEGALFLIRLDFAEPLSEETLGNLEQVCREAGIEPWPGSDYFVYADTASPAVYLVWQKGFAWLPVILGLLATIALPPLLTAGIWLILPDSLKSLISGLINMGMMLLVLFLMMSLVKPLVASEKPKPIEEKPG